MKSEKVSVIVPAYNEETHIYKNLKEIEDVFIGEKQNYEIIIVDDGSSDNTFSEAEKAARESDKIIIKKNRQNYGKGRALKYGFKFATGNLIVFLDADLDLHPRQIFSFLAIIEEGKTDIVIGSKRHAHSMLDYYPKRRRFVSYLYNLFVRILFVTHIRDTQTGLKLFKREVLDSLFHKILVNKFAFDVELLIVAHHLGYKIEEAPVEISFNREKRMGRIRIIDFMYTWWDTLAIFYRLYIQRYYLRP